MFQLINHADVICALASRTLTLMFEASQSVTDDGSVRLLPREEFNQRIDVIETKYIEWYTKIFTPNAADLANRLRAEDILQVPENLRSLAPPNYEPVWKWLSNFGTLVCPTPPLCVEDFLVHNKCEGARSVSIEELGKIARQDSSHRFWHVQLDHYRRKLRPQLVLELIRVTGDRLQDLENRSQYLGGLQIPPRNDGKQTPEIWRLVDDATLCSWLKFNWQPVASPLGGDLLRCGGLLFCSPDFAEVVRQHDEKRFKFTNAQRTVIRYMVEQYERGAMLFTASELIDQADSESLELRSVFRSNGERNPAWNDLITSPQKGRYALNLEKKSQPGENPG